MPDKLDDCMTKIDALSKRFDNYVRVRKDAQLTPEQWEEKVEDHVRGITECALHEILEQVLHVRNIEMTQIVFNRVARNLKRLGFERYRKRSGNDLKWRYRRP